MNKNFLKKIIATFLICCLISILIFYNSFITISYTSKIFYFFPLISILLSISLILIYIYFENIWQRRKLILIYAIIVSLSLHGINLGPIDPLELVAFIAFIVWLIDVLTKPKLTIITSPLILLYTLLIFLSLFSIARFKNLNPINFVAFVEKLFFFFLIINLLCTKEMLDKAIKAFIWIGIFNAVIAIFQIIIWEKMGIVLTFVEEEKNFFKPTPIGMMLRASAFCSSSTELSNILILVTPFIMFYLFFSKLSFKKRLSLIFSLFIISLAVVLTWSSSALLIFILIILLFVYVQKPSWSIHITALLAIFILMGYITGLNEWIIKEFVNIQAGGFDIRMELNKLGLEAIRRYPLTGVGIRKFGEVFASHVRKYPVHNTYLQISSEIGILGGIIFVIIIITLVLGKLTFAIFTTQKLEKVLLKTFLVCYLGFLIRTISEPLYFDNITWFLLGFIESAIFILANPNLKRHNN